jgi:hypothetical protein
MQFTEAELEALKSEHLAVFEGRIIHQALPPVDGKVLKEIEKRCAGPLPEGPIALWKVAFGGKIDYDLRVSFGDHHAKFSFQEIFYPKSNGYRDLWGWIEHEEELAQEAADEDETEWSGKLDFLPFGGFEYLDRLYVHVIPGPDYGAVIAWMQGLPPAWRLRLHEDSVARVADDVPSLFRLLALEQDPATLGDAFGSGRELLSTIDALGARGSSGASAAAKFRSPVSGTILDWRAAIENGSIATNERLRRLAFEAAARDDNVQLTMRLAGLGCSLTEKISGGGTLLDHALVHGSMALVRFLLDRNVPVLDAIRNGSGVATKELVEELLKRGAEPDPSGALGAVRQGHVDGAVLIVQALSETEPFAPSQLAERALQFADQEEDSARRVETGKMSSSESPAEMRATAACYREFAKRILVADAGQ